MRISAMVVNNPQAIAFKQAKSLHVKRKIINHLDKLIFSVILNGLSHPKESFPDSKRSVYQATEIQSHRFFFLI
jgi:hypothetical protein